MPRPATGTVQWMPARDGQPGHYRVRITCPDGSRPWIDLDPGPRSPQAEKRARERAAFYTERARREGVGAIPIRRTKASVARAAASPTFAEYLVRWIEDRKARGIADAEHQLGVMRKHFVPVLGEKRVTQITPDDMHAIVADLDAKVRERARYMATADPLAKGRRPGIAAHSAENLWRLIGKLFDDACHSKNRSLVVLPPGGDPTANVRGPDPSGRVQKNYLYPSEVLRFLTCSNVLLEFRQVVAVAIYLYLRAAELRDLHVRDVDTVHWTIRVHETLGENGERKTTKGKRSRLIPIDPALRRLIAHLVSTAHERDDFLVPRWNYDAESPILRQHLLEAGVDRAELHERRLSSSPVHFHSLRDTGITWAAIRGDDPLRIQQRAGHANFKTTSGYISEAENLSAADFGTPFPELPACLLSEPQPTDGPRGSGGSNGHASKSSGDATNERAKPPNGAHSNGAAHFVSSHESSQRAQVSESSRAGLGGPPSRAQAAGPLRAAPQRAAREPGR